VGKREGKGQHGERRHKWQDNNEKLLHEIGLD
jgi:hypothetical protein